MAITGIFDLKSATDLREKLRHDLTEFRNQPVDAYRAYNFFVTAEHLLDWQFPGYAKKSARQAARKGELLLQITSHMATGAKHFLPENKHHTTVADTRKTQTSNSGGFGTAYFGAAFFGGAPTYTHLVIELYGTAASKYGQFVNAIDIAEKVLAYWDAQIL